ncbi:MAG: BLUF domain-containing protein [Pseudomonadota bacterium]
MSDKSVFRLLYRSQSAVPVDKASAEVSSIMAVANENNAKRNITGALVLHEDTFAQFLEGEEDMVVSLFETIQKDPRHRNVELLWAKHMPERAFPEWHMVLVGDNGQPDLPLFNIGHKLAVAEREDNPEQKRALANLRAAVRK